MYSPPELLAAPEGSAGQPADCVLDARVRQAILACDATLVILGGRGWMGSATLAMLDGALDDAFLARRLRVFGSAAARITLPSGRTIACAPLAAAAEAVLRRPLLLHYAYATKDRLDSLGASGFADANAAIQSHVTRAIAAWRPCAIFFPSSGAVYRPDRSLVGDPETNLYGWLKQRDERHLAALATEHGARLTIARIFTLAGAFINKTSLYALAAFLSDIRAGGPIRIHAAHRVLRSYAHVADVVNLALAALLDGAAAAPVTCDVAGREAVELGELAALCRTVCGCPDMPILRPPAETTREDRMLGDADQYEALLRAHGLAARPLREQIRATAQWLGAC